MKNEITISMSQNFIDTIIKSELLKKVLRLKKRPILYILIINNDEISDYLKTLGFNESFLKKYYQIDNNFSCNIVIKNDLNQIEKNLLFEEFINKDEIFKNIITGNIVDCKTLISQEIKENKLYIFF